MLGLMQDWPLLVPSRHRSRRDPARQPRGRVALDRGPIHRTNYREIRKRALKVAQRLEKDGIKLGDRVATLAWNTWRHLESWYGITGIGAVYHTINPRLFPEQIAYIANHAEDRLMFLDTDLRAADGEAAGQAADDPALRDPHRRGAYAADDRCATRSPTRTGSARSMAISSGRRSTRTPRAACATRPAPPAIRRASSTRIARTCCIR